MALGKSLDLAGEETDRVKTFAGRVPAQDDPDYAKRLDETYDPPLVLHVRGRSELLNNTGLPLSVLVIQLRMDWE